RHAASVRPEPGSNSPIEFDVSDIFIVSLTESQIRSRWSLSFLFSFQRSVFPSKGLTPLQEFNYITRKNSLQVFF
ncbi:hypothetical protein, partial [Texcoconibacillus texcoconensis]|uniref:hypothetical protein n=1 Tax=Texcoconibacillus texcoconensis TaxID=1095777 RepID=UPI001C8648A3